MTYRFKNIGFTAPYIAKLTEAEWTAEAKGQYELGAKNEKDEEKILKEIHKECTKLVKKEK